MQNTASTADNQRRLAVGITDLAKRGAQLVVLQELHNTLYFCQTETVDNFNLAEPSRSFNGVIWRSGEEARRGDHSVALREAGARAIS